MLLRTFYIISILSTLTLSSNGMHTPVDNESNVGLSINSKLSELKETLTNEVAKDSDTQILKTDIQFIRAEIERQKKCELDKEMDESWRAENQVYKTDIQRLREELDNLKNEKEYTIQSLQTEIQVLKKELVQQKAFVINKDADIQKLKTDIQNLKVDLEKQTKHVRNKGEDNQKLRAELDRQDKLKRQESEQPHGCTDAKSSGVHDILVPNFSNQTFEAACDVESHGGGWTIILRRMDGSVNFTRNWAEYKNGFGFMDGEYFLGLDKIHAMTAERPHELLVLLENIEGEEAFEIYDEFAIGNEDKQYELQTLSKGEGTAGNSLSWHRLEKFTTFDKDNDRWDVGNCAVFSTGGWWYYGGFFGSHDCHYSHLTGTYNDNSFGKGVTWWTFRGNKESLKTAIMMIRPRK